MAGAFPSSVWLSFDRARPGRHFPSHAAAVMDQVQAEVSAICNSVSLESLTVKKVGFLLLREFVSEATTMLSRPPVVVFALPPLFCCRFASRWRSGLGWMPRTRS